MFTEGSKQGFELWVQRGNGTRFNEYNIKHTEGTDTKPSVTECWLESEEQEVFQIWLQKNPDCAEELRQHGWYCKLEVDGRYLRRGEVMLPYCPSRTWTETSVTTSEGVFLHDLQFSRHDTTNDPHGITLDAQAMAKVGDIELTLQQVNWTKETVRMGHSWATADQGPVLEGKKCGIKKGPAVPIQHSWYEPLDNGPPWHKFVFKYRPRGLLELMNVIESTTVKAEVDQPITATPDLVSIGKKRNRSSSSVLVKDGIEASPSVDEFSVDEQDIKPKEKFDAMQKRMRFLEEELAKAQARAKLSMVMKPPLDEVIDLTEDDD